MVRNKFRKSHNATRILSENLWILLARYVKFLIYATDVEFMER